MRPEAAGPPSDTAAADEAFMAEAVALGASVRRWTSPNPWVGCVVVPAGDGPAAEGATAPPGGPHAEVAALQLAGGLAKGSTAYVSLEPCNHHGRTPPCTEALIEAGVARVVVAVVDPDPLVSGRGLARLREAGLDVEVGVGAAGAELALAPYLKHRRTGRPWVVLKLASTLDGRTAAPDRTSRWITGPLARADAHALRAESDAVAVGAGTVRADDPRLTVRDADGRDPLRVVLGSAPVDAAIQPALEHSGLPEGLLDELGSRGVLQLLVEGGATVAGELHRAGLVDQYVIYVAPVLLGGDDGRPILAGAGSPTMDEAWRGELAGVRRLGEDVRLDVLARPAGR